MLSCPTKIFNLVVESPHSTNVLHMYTQEDTYMSGEKITEKDDSKSFEPGAGP